MDRGELQEEVARAVHEKLCQENVFAYLDMPEETAENVASAVIALVTERCAVVAEMHDHRGDVAAAIRALGAA